MSRQTPRSLVKFGLGAVIVVGAVSIAGVVVAGDEPSIDATVMVTPSSTLPDTTVVARADFTSFGSPVPRRIGLALLGTNGQGTYALPVIDQTAGLTNCGLGLSNRSYGCDWDGVSRTAFIELTLVVAAGATPGDTFQVDATSDNLALATTDLTILAPPTTTTTTTTTTVAPTTTTVTTTIAPTTTAAATTTTIFDSGATLPETGLSDSSSLSIVAMVALAGGAIALLASRRRHAPSDN